MNGEIAVQKREENLPLVTLRALRDLLEKPLQRSADARIAAKSWRCKLRIHHRLDDVVAADRKVGY